MCLLHWFIFTFFHRTQFKAFVFAILCGIINKLLKLVSFIRLIVLMLRYAHNFQYKYTLLHINELASAMKRHPLSADGLKDTWLAERRIAILNIPNAWVFHFKASLIYPRVHGIYKKNKTNDRTRSHKMHEDRRKFIKLDYMYIGLILILVILNARVGFLK